MAAANIQAKQAMKTAPAGYQAASQLGATTAANKGQAMIEQASKAATTDTRLAEVGLAEKGMNERAELSGLERGLRQRRESNLDRVAKLGSEIQDRILTSRLKFQTDQAGQKYLNERQLADFAIMKIKSDEEFADLSQQVQQDTERKLAMMEVAQKKIQQILSNKHLQEQLGLDFEAKKELAEMARAHEKAMAKAKNDAANKAAMWGAAGTVVGAGLGSLGGPAGAMAGGAIGGGLGTAAAGAFG
jgi:hypothetical protein